MSWLSNLWAMTAPESVSNDAAVVERNRTRTMRDWSVDAAAFVFCVVCGAISLRIAVDDFSNEMTGRQIALDVSLGMLTCVALWWRRRWPFGVALFCVIVGALSTFGTIAGVLALTSLALYRHIRPALLIAGLFIPAAVACSIWLGRTNTASVILPTAAMTAAAIAWGMFVRARRQLVATLRDRAVRAEAELQLRAESARMSERTRIAREMHDVLAHRISLVALHAGALEVARELPPEQVRESAALLRSTAHQALDELRDVIGVLRDKPGEDASTVPQPTLADIPRLVEETRRSGAKVDFEMHVDGAAGAPGPLGRDAYRIVQEALTNVSKHARGTQARVRVAGAPSRGLRVTVRNPTAIGTAGRASVPGSGSGLLGLQERVALANGVLVHGPDGSGDFVVEADLPW
jgi:signal transduction histidine kinase